MPEPHIIRLRGPWLLEPLEQVGQASDAMALVTVGDQVKTDVPSDWSGSLGVAFRGRVKYTRRFGRPSGLSPQHRVYLCVTRVDYTADVLLNGRPLGRAVFEEPARLDVTSLLEHRNELNIHVALLPADDANRADRANLAGGLTGEVYLEILE